MVLDFVTHIPPVLLLRIARNRSVVTTRRIRLRIEI